MRTKGATAKHLWRQLPPIAEAWKESSVMHRLPYSSWLPVQEREIRLERTLKHVRTLVSLEEVFGPGLLERMNNVSIACSWEPK